MQIKICSCIFKVRSISRMISVFANVFSLPSHHEFLVLFPQFVMIFWSSNILRSIDFQKQPFGARQTPQAKKFESRINSTIHQYPNAIDEFQIVAPIQILIIIIWGRYINFAPWHAHTHSHRACHIHFILVHSIDYSDTLIYEWCRRYYVYGI